MEGIDPNTLAQYPLIVIVLGAIGWAMRFFRDALLKIVEKHAETEARMAESLDKNSDRLDTNTNTLTNLDKTIALLDQRGN